MTQATKQALATYRQARDYLSISQPTLYRLIKAGELHVVFVGTARRIEWAEIESYIASRRQSLES